MLRTVRKPYPQTRRISAFAVVAVLLTGMSQVLLPARAAHAAGPNDHVVFWNDVLLRTFKQQVGAPGPLARAGAMMHVAMYDAANSVLCARRAADCLGQPYAIKVASGGDFNTALDYAAHGVLTEVYGDNFDNDLMTAQMDIPDSPEKTAGASVGVQAAQAIVQLRETDGSDAPMSYTEQGVPGSWRQTGSGQAATPAWGEVTPFAMTSGSQFRPEMPAGADTYEELLTSQVYTDQFNEVKQLGRRTPLPTGPQRTQDQTDAAYFWANDADGTYKPPGQLFDHTQQIAADQNVAIEPKVKLFAQVAIGMADAAILAWDSKYLTPTDLWRPVSAIQEAGSDGNPDTTADPTWQPLAASTPSFPAYVSGHATFAYTWATVMQHWFGRDDITFTGGTDDPDAPGMTRTFSSFSAAADENAHSRLWLGVHFHFDADNVLNPGAELGEFSVDNTLYYNTSPTELLYTHKDGVTNPDECDDLGRQLSNEHRWEFWRCDVDGTSYDLYVR